MAFNPDSYLQKNAPALQPGGFDPDAYLSKQSKPDSSAGQTALESYGNTATLGYLPQIQAAVEKPMSRLLDFATGNDVSESLPDYVERRDENLRRQDALSKENPKASLAGTALGIGATALAPIGVAAKGASTLGRVAQAGKIGAIYGAAQNPGDIEGEISPLQIEGRARNAAIGGALGAGSDAALQAISIGARKVSPILRDYASRKAFQALGPTKAASERAMDRGQDVAIGRTLLDEGAIPILGSPGRIQGRVEALSEKTGKRYGDILDQTQAAIDAKHQIPPVAGEKLSVDTKALAERVKSSPEHLELGSPGMEGGLSRANAALETLASKGDLNLREAQALRRGIDKSINFGKRSDEMAPAMGSLYAQRSGIRDEMNRIVNDASSRGWTDIPADELKAMGRAYNNVETASDIVGKRVAGDASNRSISLTDTMAALAGAASGGGPLKAAVTGGLAGATNKAVRVFGRSAAARGANKASEASSAISRALDKASTASVGAVSALLAGSRDFTPSDLSDPELLDTIRKNPMLLEHIVDPKVRAQLERSLGRDPSAIERRLKSQ